MARGLHEKSKTHEKTKTTVSLKSAALGLTMLSALVIAGVTSAATPRTAAAAQPTQSASTAAPPCPTGYSCVTIPCSTGTCPTVEAGPTSDLGTNPAQYAFIDLYDFPAGDSPEIALCADTAPLSQSAPLCSEGPAPVYAPIFSDGTGFISYQVIEDESGPGQTPISGEILGDDAQKGTFYCDNGPDLCSLVVFDANLDDSSTPDTSNTALMPVTYAASTGGCPGAALVNTESDFGIEGLIGAANQSGCTGSKKAIAFNAALDSESAVSALGAGQVQIAFTDDPEALDEQQILGGSKSPYALIPVAASADVLGFAANIQGFPPDNHTLYPQVNFELTPNMVAGMIADPLVYDGVGNADLLAGFKCANPGIPPPKKIDPCPGEEALNSLPSFQPQLEYTGYVRSDTAGVTDELLHWLCAAPDHTVPINGKIATETDTAAQILESTQWSDTSLDGTCPQTDQFPGLASPAILNADLDPENQIKALYSQVGSGDPPRQAGFAVMNWYEALYYGLNSAALQNAAGQFVIPSEASIEKALGDATTNPDGTLAFNYTDTADTAAYPEPVVFYAAVSTTPEAAAQADATKKVLDNILALTASPGSSALPAGIVPLPASLTTQAEADIAKDIVAKPSTGNGNPGKGSGTGKGSGHSSGGGSSTGTGGTGSSTGQSQSSGSTTSGGGQSSSSTPTTATRAHTTSTNARTGSTTKRSPGPPSLPHGGVFRAVQVALAAPEWRWLLGGMLIVGAIAIGTGPLLLLAQRLRRRLAAIRGRT
ncbi:MAG: hypothetical protein ACLP6E_05615 [Acidimicrobiales bacterium]